MEQNQANITPDITVPVQSPSTGNDFFKVQQPAAPSFLQKYGTIIFIVGMIIGVLLIVLGIIFHTNYKPEGVSERSVETIQAEIAELDTQISDSVSAGQAVFEQGGFSEAFFESNNSLADLEFRRSDLQHELDTLIQAKDSINVFTTGAFYFFVAAFVVLIISTVLFILSRRKTQNSSSIIA